MSSVKDFILRHPRLTAWFVLAVGMVAILVWSARDVGLLAHQWAALIVATIGLAGLCVWIIGWEDDEEDEDEQGAPEQASQEPVVEATADESGDSAGGSTDEAATTDEVAVEVREDVSPDGVPDVQDSEAAEDQAA